MSQGNEILKLTVVAPTTDEAADAFRLLPVERRIPLPTFIADVELLFKPWALTALGRMIVLRVAQGRIDFMRGVGMWSLPIALGADEQIAAPDNGDRTLKIRCILM